MFLGYLNVSSDIHYYTLQSGEDVCDFTDPSGLPLQGFKAKCELVKEASSPYNKSSVFLSVRVSDRPKIYVMLCQKAQFSGIIYSTEK